MRRIDTRVPLLSTKLYVPPARSSHVLRPRLMARLRQGMDHPLTLISAPAGSGKTTLVSAWRASAAGRDVPLAWLSLDEQDNDPTRFLTYLVATLRTLKPELDEVAFSMLQPPQLPPLQPFLTGLINDLGELAKPSALVLDDYHVITAQPIHEAFTFLLDHLPPHLHLILLTRVDPPLPLPRLRVRNQLIEIRAGDLRFTADEAAVFFNQVMGLSLSRDDVEALEQRTEGWIAGLQLAALALQAPRFIERTADASAFIDAFLSSFSGSHPYVADYLAEEVLSRQSEEVKTFLLQTSILDRMTGELCDSLTGRSDSQVLLRQLDQANLFLVPLDEQRRWYRYHRLFAELLRNHLQEATPDQFRELHRRAAGWYERHGFVSEAIKHFLAAGDQQRTAQIIERNAMARLMHGDSVTVLNWINAVTPLLQGRPWLVVYQSWAQVITGEIEQIEARLQTAESWIDSHASDTNAREMGFHIAAIRALVAHRRGKARQAIDLASQALERLPGSEPTIRSIITLTLGDARWSIGDLTGAKQVFTQASRIDRGASSPFVAVLALSSTGVLLTEQGQLHRAAETFKKVIHLTTQTNGRKLPAAAVACLGLSGLAYEWNHLTAAGRYAQQAIELGSRWGNPDTLAKAHLMQARWQQTQGDTVGALESLRQAEELARGPGVAPWSGMRIDAFRVQLWLEQANLEAAARWARQHALDLDDEISYPHQVAYLILARILVAQNRLDAALSLLERLLAQFETLGQMGRALELLLLRALALQAQGDKPGALAVLARALALGEPEGYLRIFLDEGAPMIELLRHAGSRGIAPKYVANLLSEFNQGAGATPASQQPLIKPLTDRELQVLRLLAEGLSNQAIADRLVVALGTVKSHTASLYRKLDVTSRTQAVARATDLGLL